MKSGNQVSALFQVKRTAEDYRHEPSAPVSKLFFLALFLLGSATSNVLAENPAALDVLGGGSDSTQADSAENTSRTPINSAYEAIYDESHSGDRKNDLITAFDGWSQMYVAYGRTPIVLDPVSFKRMYPEFADCYKGSKQARNPASDICGDTKGRRSLRNVGISQDDEITKVTLATFIPLEFLQRDASISKEASNQNMGISGGVRGASNITLGALDSGIAGGLATTSQQIGSDVIAQLLKQISHNTAQLANPSRNQMYVDTQEKIEWCMAVNGEIEEGGKLAQKAPHVKFQVKRCETFCDPARNRKQQQQGGSNGSGLQGGQNSGGTYAYCVCCSEQSMLANFSVINPEESDAQCGDGQVGTMDDKKKKECWSLTDRVFYGYRAPENYQPANTKDRNAQSLVRDVVATSREMYGDIIMKGVEDRQFVGPPAQGNQNSTNTAQAENPYQLSIQTITPTFSIAQKINAFRDGCRQCDGDGANCVNSFGPAKGSWTDFAQNGDNGKPIACPITGLRIQAGVCPSLIRIIRDWDEIKDLFARQNQLNSAPVPAGGFGLAGAAGVGLAAGVQQVARIQNDRELKGIRRLWTEASLGHLLTARDIEALIKIFGVPNFGATSAAVGGLGGAARDGWRPSGKLLRWLENFCDASAIAAFKRFHYRMKSITLDHLSMSRKASDNDKAQMLRLIDRIDQQLALAEADAGANWQNSQQLTGISIAFDREKQAFLAAAAAANQSMQNMTSQIAGAGGQFGGGI